MKACCVAVLSAVLLACASLAPAAEYAGIGVRGDPAFVAQTRAALVLLQAHAPEAVEIVRRGIGTIAAAERSGLDPFTRGRRPVFQVGPRTASASPTWYASAIAHDAFHAVLYLEAAQRGGRPVPDDAWTGPGPERQAIAFQLGVLRAVGAPAHEVAWLLEADGTHPDIDRDGIYSREDYDARDW